MASGAQFSSVSGSWVQPSVNCSSGGDTYSAFWVGIGGASGSSDALEQVGTQADCSGGSAQHYAWYELVPAAPVQLNLTINPGDHVSATVTVSGSSVTMSITDHTNGGSATKTLQMSNPSPDTSSAEWIAEAPSSCDGTGNCTPLTLADFGKVSFTSASATGNGQTGPISDSNWQAQPVALDSSSFGGFVSDQSGSGAQPSSLSSNGSSFSVSYGSGSGQSVSSDPTGQGYGSSSGYGYGSGSGYGYGGGSGYGSSSGYGGGTGYGYGGGSSYGYGGGTGYGYGGGSGDGYGYGDGTGLGYSYGGYAGYGYGA